jgi:cytochrome P450
MAYLLYDPTLYTSVRSEIDSALSAGPGGLAERLESCVQLVSIYNEILRLNTASASIRAVAATTDLGDVTLSAGAKVLIPYRQFHFDTKVFGGNASQFDAGRFLNSGLSKDPSFRPFGGGTTYCSGRYLAKREVLTFLALALSRYDIELATGKPATTQTRFPICDVKMSSLGILPPVAGDDVHVVIRNRVLAA